MDRTAKFIQSAREFKIGGFRGQRGILAYVRFNLASPVPYTLFNFLSPVYEEYFFAHLGISNVVYLLYRNYRCFQLEVYGPNNSGIGVS
jgi:hypothetical protein